MTEGQETAPAAVSPPKPVSKLTENLVLVVVTGIMICVIIGVFAYSVSHIVNNPTQQVQVVQQSTPVQTVTPAPTPVPTPTLTPLPGSVTFTVLQANQAQYNAPDLLSREYSVYTTDGRIMVLPDFYSWDSLYPNYAYTCVVTGTQSGYGTIYTVNNCIEIPTVNPVVILSPDNYYYGYDYYRNHIVDYDSEGYTYYHNGDNYFRCNRYGDTCSNTDTHRIPVYVSIHESYPPHYTNTHPVPITNPRPDGNHNTNSYPNTGTNHNHTH